MFETKGRPGKGTWAGMIPMTGAALLLLFAYYAFTWRSFAGFQAAIDTCGRPFCDFASFYYPMGETIFLTGLPVTGFVYSPFIALLLSVFPPLGFNAALVLWGTLQALSIVFYLLLFRRLVPASLAIQLLFTALALSSFPLLHILTWGQVGLFTTIAILGALVFYERGQTMIAAALLAFGLSFKFFPILFLVPFVVRRDIRFLLLAAGACGLFLFVVPGVLVGVDGMLRFYSALLDSYQHFDWVRANYNSQFFPHVMLRLAQAAGYDHVMVRLAQAVGYDARIYLSILRWIAYSIAVVNMGFVFLVQRARLHYANLWSFHILFLSIPFILQTSWPVDLVYISFAQGLLAWKILEGKKTVLETDTGAGRTFTLVLLLASIISSNIIFFNFIGDHYDYGFYGFIFWSDLLLLIASYVELLPSALRQIRMGSGDMLLSGRTASTGTVTLDPM